jgi:GNAT superfamily N-acetyltransferase
MIRDCTPADVDAVFAVIDDAAQAYRGAIPADRWHEPYMPAAELAAEIAAGVAFRLWVEDGPNGGERVTGVMGGQPVQDVFLIRHAYVRTARRRQGIGAALLADLVQRTDRPVLIGTWAAAAWAVRFYEKHGFRQVTPAEKDRLLRRYWTVPQRQIAASVVLADARWFAQRGGA